MKIIRAFAPATVANLGPGFDILGMAVTEPGDIVTVRESSQPGVIITRVNGAGLPLDATQNTAGIAAEYVRQQIAPQAGVELELDKGLPLASGLGSSAASAVAAAVAVNGLFGNPLSPIELLPALLEAEAAVSGRHLDNVAPALLGGIVLVTGIGADDVDQLPVGRNIFDACIALVTPDIAVPTVQARAVLPPTVPLKTVVDQTKGIARLLHAIYTDDVQALGHAMMQDHIIEVAREHLIPHLAEARQAALTHGALAAIISGAGPTICILAENESVAQNSGAAVQAIFHSNNIQAVLRVVHPARRGAYIIEG